MRKCAVYRGKIREYAHWHGRRLVYILHLHLAFLVPRLEVGWPVQESDIDILRAMAPNLLLLWFRDRQ